MLSVSNDELDHQVVLGVADTPLWLWTLSPEYDEVLPCCFSSVLLLTVNEFVLICSNLVGFSAVTRLRLTM